MVVRIRQQYLVTFRPPSLLIFADNVAQNDLENYSLLHTWDTLSHVTMMAYSPR